MCPTMVKNDPSSPRIYDDPNHPYYGPVRRMWTMLQNIWSIDYAKYDKMFYDQSPVGYWDQEMISYFPEFKEHEAHRQLMFDITLMVSRDVQKQMRSTVDV